MGGYPCDKISCHADFITRLFLESLQDIYDCFLAPSRPYRKGSDTCVLNHWTTGPINSAVTTVPTPIVTWHRKPTVTQSKSLIILQILNAVSLYLLAAIRDTAS